MKALVVDDSAVMRKVLTGALGRVGISDVDQAEDGERAVAAVTANEYGVILMDWNMPKLSGLEALKQIRALGKTVPVIMVTTESEKARVMDALKAGANNYILKPFEPMVIAEKIRSVIEAHVAK
jgi:two-component system, chemotaxis family, chemotaxis protein CheY